MARPWYTSAICGGVVGEWNAARCPPPYTRRGKGRVSTDEIVTLFRRFVRKELNMFIYMYYMRVIRCLFFHLRALRIHSIALSSFIELFVPCRMEQLT